MEVLHPHTRKVKILDIDFKQAYGLGSVKDECYQCVSLWLLLDSRVVDVPMAYDPPFVMLSSLKPLFVNRPEKELRFSDNTGA